jgi:alkanesulfonate monooxygenase SsuD/methylene tetrahydromethanopterin reductase-like flavin-dependent oxidoreductase (luciferase family)
VAKAITTLDVISQGRANLGIGTGWFELEQALEHPADARGRAANGKYYRT